MDNKIQSHFHQVREFHEAFGLPVSETPNHNMIDKDEKTKKLRIDLIKEELDELKEAIVNKDMVDATIGDIAWFTTSCPAVPAIYTSPACMLFFLRGSKYFKKIEM